MNFFAAIAAEAPDVNIERHLPSVKPWDQRTMLSGEKETLGFHVSGHPLDQHEDTLRTVASAASANTANLRDETPVVLGGQLTRVRLTIAKTGKSAGQKMAMLTVQDRTGQIDGVIFADSFARHGSLLQDDAILLFIGRIDLKRGEPQIIIEQLVAVADAPQHLAGRIEIDLVDDPQNDPLETRMQLVAGLLKQAGAARHSNGGRPAEVHVHLVCEQRRHTLKLNRERIIAEPEVLQRLRETVGTDCVRVVSGGVPRLRENGRGNGAKWASQRPQPAEV
jgi:DNA polymerase-3 subunit alpha